MARLAREETRQEDWRSGDSVALAGRRVVILGLARQGLALAHFALEGGAAVTISDMAPAEQVAVEAQRSKALGATLELGGHPLSLLDGCDLLCLSGGVAPQIPIVQEAIRRGIRLSNDSLLTLQIAHTRGLGPVIAITGSSGKTTTTTLVGLMLDASGKTAHVGGNIGAPLIDRMTGIGAGEAIVLELSSFQLELFDPALAAGRVDGVGPHIAAILNLTPNHLDRHPSMAAYAGAKLNLLRCLPAGSVVSVSADDAVTRVLLPGAAARAQQNGTRAREAESAWALQPLLDATREEMSRRAVTWQPFSREQRLDAGAWMEGDALIWNQREFARRGEVRLRGEHNLGNLLAAAAIAGAAGATVEGMGRVARSFAGVPHRLEIVGEWGGVLWVNDSIATSPERAVAGLRSFDPAEQTIILLTGGKDKNLPWDLFAEEVLDRVSYLIGFGQSGAMIVDTVRAHADYARRTAPASAVVQRLDEAVELAARSASPGSVVLLSPGGTSYDAYRDFAARGEHFRALVEQYGARQS